MLGAHPYNVRPVGAAYDGTETRRWGATARQAGLGALAALEDHVVLAVLGVLGAAELLNVSRCSKALYVFAGTPELWRALTLGRYGGRFAFAASGSWRDTLFAAAARERGEPPPPPHAPLRDLPPLYSDALFQPWLCAARPLEEAWLEGDGVPRRRASALGLRAFRDEFEAPNTPVVLEGACAAWPAAARWDRDRLAGAYGPEGEAVAGGFRFGLRDYFAYCDAVERHAADDQPLYLFDRDFASAAPGLAADYEVPEYFSDASGQDLFALLGERERPDYRWLIVGPARSGSAFHKDPNATSAWNAVVRGSKKWILYPPHVTPPGVNASADGATVESPMSLVEWLGGFLEEARAGPGPPPLECVVRAGDVLFVPRGWWHMAINLEETVAITQNFVSPANLPHVLRFLDTQNEELVSGLRDAEARRSLGRRFRAVLGEKRPELLRAVAEQERAREERTKAHKKLSSLFGSDAGGAAVGGSFTFGFGASGAEQQEAGPPPAKRLKGLSRGV